MHIDYEFISRIKDGEHDAIVKLYDYCRLDAMKLAIGYDINNAESLFHEAFLRAIEKIDLFDVNRDFLPWFKTILENICRRYVSREARSEDSIDDDSLLWIENEYSDDNTPEKILMEREAESIIRDIINELPDEQREAVFLFYYKGSSIAEIAKIQSVNENTIKSRLNYSKKKLEKGVEDYQRKTGVKLYSFAPVMVIALRAGAVSEVINTMYPKWDMALYGEIASITDTAANVGIITESTIASKGADIGATIDSSAVSASSGVKAGVLTEEVAASSGAKAGALTTGKAASKGATIGAAISKGIGTKIAIAVVATTAVVGAGIAIDQSVNKDKKDKIEAKEVVIEQIESSESVGLETVDVEDAENDYSLAESTYLAFLEQTIYQDYPLVDNDGIYVENLVADFYYNDGNGAFLSGEYGKCYVSSDFNFSFFARNDKYKTGTFGGTLCYAIEDFDNDSVYELLVIKNDDGKIVYEIYEDKNDTVELQDSLSVDYEICYKSNRDISILDNGFICDKLAKTFENGNTSSEYTIYKYDGKNLVSEQNEIATNINVKYQMISYEEKYSDSADYFDALLIYDFGTADVYNEIDYYILEKNDCISSMKEIARREDLGNIVRTPNGGEEILDFYYVDIDYDGSLELFFRTISSDDMMYFNETDFVNGRLYYVDGEEIKFLYEVGIDSGAFCDCCETSDGKRVFIYDSREGFNYVQSTLFVVENGELTTLNFENKDSIVYTMINEAENIEYDVNICTGGIGSIDLNENGAIAYVCSEIFGESVHGIIWYYVYYKYEDGKYVYDGYEVEEGWITAD